MNSYNAFHNVRVSSRIGNKEWNMVMFPGNAMEQKIYIRSLEQPTNCECKNGEGQYRVGAIRVGA